MIRKAETANSETLTQIALDAKRYWGYPEHWIKRWEADLTITSDFIDANHVYVAEDNGEIRGFYALCIVQDRAELEHLWVRPAYIGTGLGKELFLDAMERVAQMNVRELQLTADPNAAGFYRKMGAEQIGESYSQIDGQSRILPRMKVDL